MTIARMRLKVKVIGQGQGHGQANAVGPTSMEGSFSSCQNSEGKCFESDHIVSTCMGVLTADSDVKPQMSLK